jgi:hypothetical protein
VRLPLEVLPLEGQGRDATPRPPRTPRPARMIRPLPSIAGRQPRLKPGHDTSPTHREPGFQPPILWRNRSSLGRGPWACRRQGRSNPQQGEVLTRQHAIGRVQRDFPTGGSRTARPLPQPSQPRPRPRRSPGGDRCRPRTLPLLRPAAYHTFSRAGWACLRRHLTASAIPSWTCSLETVFVDV